MSSVGSGDPQRTPANPPITTHSTWWRARTSNMARASSRGGGGDSGKPLRVTEDRGLLQHVLQPVNSLSRGEPKLVLDMHRIRAIEVRHAEVKVQPASAHRPPSGLEARYRPALLPAPNRSL